MKRLGAGVLAVGLVVIGGLAPGPASAADKVSLILNWYLGGLHTPFYLGVANGCYARETIDLSIEEGRGSVRAVQVVGAKGATFGMSDAGSLMIGVSRGTPLKAVMSLLNTSGFAIIGLETTGIRTAKDLEGKKLAVSPGDALTQLFPAVVKANGLDASKIELVFMDPPAKVPATLEGRTDALLGGIDDQFFLIEQQGRKAVGLRFADLGVNTVGMTIHAHEDTIRDRPDLVRRFVKGTVCAWEAAKADPDAAVAAALKVKPDLDRDSTKKQLLVDLGLLESPATKGKGIGYAAAEDWERTKELLVQYRDLRTDRPAMSFVTNEFLPR
ncbi:MAG: sulfonate ABC transporter substrate-binding protein [Geminicoccaceae bacterium]|jgi:NitT/TauT family transport system substrate-binding protein|nr:MAG: sulfonate ABC transporter substrate-binding protein [Geminicoccaceae bacterium]